jgi:alcohol dehydrogenase
MRNSVTVRGQWMLPRAPIGQAIALARSGLLDLTQFKTTSFGLDDVADAIAHAAADGGRFSATLLQP